MRWPDALGPARLAPALLAALALLAAPSPAVAQEDEEEAVAAAAVAPARVFFGMDDSNFDAWVYGGRVVGDGRDWFEARLSLRMEEIDRACKLTYPQRAKLRLAGRGDTKRFFDIYDEKRRKFQSLKHDQNRINEIFQEIRPLQEMIAGGAFNRGSIFDKTIRSTLTPEQTSRFDEVARERRAARYRARVELAVEMIDGYVGLAADRRRQLVDVIAGETKVPPRTGQYEFYLVIYQAGQIPEEKIRPLFDEAQWKVMSQLLRQAKQYESFLKAGGMLETPAGEKPAAVDKPAAKMMIR